MMMDDLYVDGGIADRPVHPPGIKADDIRLNKAIRRHQNRGTRVRNAIRNRSRCVGKARRLQEAGTKFP